MPHLDYVYRKPYLRLPAKQKGQSPTSRSQSKNKIERLIAYLLSGFGINQSNYRNMKNKKITSMPQSSSSIPKVLKSTASSAETTKGTDLCWSKASEPDKDLIEDGIEEVDEYSLDEELRDNVRDIDYKHRSQAFVLLKSITVHKSPEKISKLNTHVLRKIAKNVNSSKIHFSGNCVLLSRCLLYNLKKGKIFLSGQNTYPIFQAVNSIIAEKIIFGKILLKDHRELKNIDQVVDEILNRYRQTRTSFYAIDFIHNNKEKNGHSFNAVVLLDDEGAPYVQFVDSWKTSNHLPSQRDLSSRYADGRFIIASDA